MIGSRGSVPLRLRVLFAVAQVFLGLLLSADAFASNRSVCFRMMFNDARTRGTCAGGQETGALRGCKTGLAPDPGGYVDFVGGIFELWDKDDPNDPSTDDFIGRYVYILNASDQKHVCVTFPWEGTTAQTGDGEAHPDVYVVGLPQVVATNNQGPWVQMVDDFGALYFPVSFRDIAVINDVRGFGYYMPGYIYLTDGGVNPSWELAAYTMLDSAQHALEVYKESAPGVLSTSLFGPNNPSGTPITIQFQNAACCGAAAGTPQACTINRNKICVNGGAALDGMMPAHELGHVLQERIFGQDTLRDVITTTTNNSHQINLSCGTDSCATTEGWADYVAVRSWYDPENSMAVPYSYSFQMDPDPDTYFGSTCAGNTQIEGQVMKAFWDLDDSYNEASGPLASGWADTVDLGTYAMAQVWDNFPDGTANGQDYEAGNNGVNVYDYYNNGPLDFNRSTTLIQHNCLTNQNH
jgi:hypothetical protein